MDWTLAPDGTPVEYLTAWTRRSRRDQDGEDRMQDAALLYMAHPGTLADGSPVTEPAGFLVALAYGRARNEAKRLIRREKRHKGANKETPSATVQPLALDLALSSVGINPARVDTRLIKLLTAGHTLAETADRLGVSQPTVSRRVAELRDTCARINGWTFKAKATKAMLVATPADFRAASRKLATAEIHDLAMDRHVRPTETRPGVTAWIIEDGRGNRIGRTYSTPHAAARLLTRTASRVYWHAE